MTSPPTASLVSAVEGKERPITATVLRRGPACFDMVGQRLPYSLHNTDQVISNGTVKRLHWYALRAMADAGFDVSGWACEVYTMDGDDRPAELTVRAPLIEQGITKAATLAMVERAGLKLPRSYAMGFPNANCLRTGCGKAKSPRYWSLFREHFPAEFARTAAYSRQIGARLTELNGERAFLDEIPADYPTTNAIVPACDFLCVIAEQGLEAAE